MSLFYQQTSGRHPWANSNPFLEKVICNMYYQGQNSNYNHNYTIHAFGSCAGIVSSLTPIS